MIKTLIIENQRITLATDSSKRIGVALETHISMFGTDIDYSEVIVIDDLVCVPSDFFLLKLLNSTVEDHLIVLAYIAGFGLTTVFVLGDDQ